MPVAVEELLGQPEPEHVRVELRSLRDLFGGDKEMVDTGRGYPLESLRNGMGVRLGQEAADGVENRIDSP